ncbi:choice-of-anchor J domain-containing protein [Candidatus Sumerlaeota bacterium]|nr:choice-of-anchor J domain-containing protein [Candidatus Sumerlaeota bacterium]
MRKICYILLAGLAALLLTLPVYAGGYRYLFFEDFDDVVEPALPASWATEDTNLSGATWHSRDVAGYQGSGCSRILSEAPATNDWIFTPTINLTGGVQYTLTFKTRVTGGTSHSMNVFYGTAQNSMAMTNPIIILPPINNLDPLETSVNFTPVSTGGYYIGFQCVSPGGNWGLFLDDVCVAIPEPDLQVQLIMQKAAMTGSNSYSASEEKMCHIILKNNGSGSIVANTWFSIGDSNDPHTALSFVVRDPGSAVVPYQAKNRVGIPRDSDFKTLAPGDSTSKYFDLNNGGFDFSQIGTYTIEVEYENLYPATSGFQWEGKIISDPVTIQIN